MTTARETIQDLYDKDDLTNIVNHGCVSGSAHRHIYTSDCVDFYNEYQDEIDEYICDVMGLNTVMEITTECYDIQHAMSHLCWLYIDLMAGELLDEESEEEEYSYVDDLLFV